MPWLVKFRGKEFTGNEGWDPEFEDAVLRALTDKRELSGSAKIVFQLEGDFIDDVTIYESTDPDKFPLKGIHGNHVELGEVFIFSGVPDEGEGEVIALYSNNVLPDGPFNSEPFTGDDKQDTTDDEPRLL